MKRKLRPLAKVALKDTQAKRLSMLTNISIEELKGKTILEIEKDYKLMIDPKLFLFQRVCGQVVKYDPISGKELPVPFATVHVEDTDCNFIALYPSGFPWGWFYPIFCHREEIASVVTDACGRFCVWIPRFETDWIMKWRLQRVCYPEIFIRPTIRDLLEKIIEIPPILYEPPPFPPRPFPPPPPDLIEVFLKNREMILRRTEEAIGREAAERLATVEGAAVFGGERKRFSEILNAPAFRERVPPPLAPQLMDRLKEQIEKAEKLLEIRTGHNPVLAVERFVGPFLRCRLVLVPEVMPISDVPDITFRVTQDVDDDGLEETIYSESFFDVRWDADPIPDVKLYASDIALTGAVCDTPDIPSGKPAIVTVGLMPLHNPPAPTDPYHDASTGYARRPNRPHPSGLYTDPPPNPLAQTPFTRTLQLYGRNHAPGADYYRVLYQFNGAEKVPFKSTWKVYRLVGTTLKVKDVVPDAKGWYPILPATEDWFPSKLLMNWPSGAAGLYNIQLELGDSAKNSILTTDPIGIRVDNSLPDGRFTGLWWREHREPSEPLDAWKPLDINVCPVIKRPTGKDIDIRVTFQAWATHLRSVILTAGGCGAGIPELTSTTETAEHWHTGPSDNSFDNSGNPAIFRLSKTALQGAYRFVVRVDGRTFNPAGGDGGFEADWNYKPLYRWIRKYIWLAVVNV